MPHMHSAESTCERVAFVSALCPQLLSSPSCLCSLRAAFHGATSLLQQSKGVVGSNKLQTQCMPDVIKRLSMKEAERKHTSCGA